ncbi:alpha/beta hydrolase [Chitinophaga sedimenti]|nr:alpha/beta hydrolase [Chitinophaga sedimenti]
MFKNLMTALSDRLHLVAPDFPGFGFSAFPPKDEFEYTFRNIGACMNRFTEEINLKQFTIYLHDYGCPVGLQICIHHPEKITGIIVQNGNAYEEGVAGIWDEMRAYWANPTPEKKKELYGFLSEEGVKWQYTAGVPEALLPTLSPELWVLDWDSMKRPGNIDMQYELNCDYANHIASFPVFQAYFRKHQPRTIVIWGKYDPFFNVEEAACYRRDLPNAEIHLIEGSHWVLETNFDEVLRLISNFFTPAATQ